MSALHGQRLALRRLRRSPGFAAMTILTLAAALAPVLMVAAFLDALVARPLPYPEPDALLRVYHHRIADGDSGTLSLPTFRDVDRALRSVDAQRPPAVLATFEEINATLADEDGLERVAVMLVSAGFFDVLGVAPAVGRFFVPGEDLPEAPRAVVLGHRLWQQRYGGAADIVSRQILVDAQPHNVVGVMPPGLELPGDAELWIPFNERVHGMPRFDRNLDAIARLAPGTGLGALQTRLDAIAARLLERYPEEPYRFVLVPLKHSFTEEVAGPLRVLFGVVLLVLLAASANLANLALARAATRETEQAIRIACGAEPGVARGQLLSEMAWLTAAGGLLGCVAAALACRALVAVLPVTLPVYLEPRVDGRILVLAALLLLVIHGAFGLLPTGRGRGAVQRLVHGRGPIAGAPAWRRRFVQVQTALAFVLLTVTALLVHDARRLGDIDPGFMAEPVLTMRLALPPARYPSAEQAALFYRELRGRLASRLDTERIAFAAHLPVDSVTSGTHVLLEGQTDRHDIRHQTLYTVITPGYFRTLGVPVLAGRGIDRSDGADAVPAVVVNRSWLRRNAPEHDERSIVGAKALIGFSPHWGRVVGVVPDLRHQGLAAPAGPHAYFAQGQFPWWEMSLLVAPEDSAAAAEVVDAVRRTVRGLDPAVPVFDPVPLRRHVAQSLFLQRSALVLVTGLGIMILGLAIIGLIGVVAFDIHRERRAIGLRLAVGATPWQIRRRYLRRVLADVGVAAALGLGAALALRPALDPLLAASAPPMLAVVATAAATLLAAATAAAWLASRKASRVDPSEIL